LIENKHNEYIFCKNQNLFLLMIRCSRIDLQKQK